MSIDTIKSQLSKLSDDYLAKQWSILRENDVTVMNSADEILKDATIVSDEDYRCMVDYVLDQTETGYEIDIYDVLSKHLLTRPFDNKAGIYLYEKFASLDYLVHIDTKQFLSDLAHAGNIDALVTIAKM